MTDANAVWLDVLQQLAGRSAHEIKGALNGVALSLEVVRSRTAGGKKGDVADFATAAADHLELLTARVEAMLFLTREPKPPAPADLGIILRHMAALLEPSAKADGGALMVEGLGNPALTAAPVAAARLALAAGMLALIKEGGVARVILDTGSETVVRFSHQSATAVNLDPEVTSALGKHGIKSRRSPADLHIVFP